VLEINGTLVTSNNQVKQIVTDSDGQPLAMLIKRDGKTFDVKVTPVKSVSENRYMAGMWIRDSSAGIGTLTFYSPAFDISAGLGHGICDTDTEKLIPLQSGQFLKADIVGIKKSSSNVTGELQGVFSGGQIADFIKNDITGVYGSNCCNFDEANIMHVAMKQEIKTGEAKIVTTLDAEGPKMYDCVIEKIYHNDDSLIKNMVIKVTDPVLLEKTGGIVQGMSGSPIIQDGKFVGAITHVFVDDCTSGYAIFAENMLESAKNISVESPHN
jgi:stage IV sporulation protein B